MTPTLQQNMVHTFGGSTFIKQERKGEKSFDLALLFLKMVLF